MKTPPENPSTRSVPSARSPRKRLRPAGGYRSLASFQTATLIYDATYWFIEKFLDPRSRLADQMLMAARSGRQNIAEGSRFAATSSQTELRLVNVARSSLEELLLDYEDYLFHRHLPQWAPESQEALAVRAIGQRLPRDQSDPPDPSDPQAARRALHARYARWLEHAEAAPRANALICLIHQTNYLLDQQISALEQAFIEEGGYSEQLATARLAHRTRPRDPSDQSDPPDPIPRCPQCGAPMALRTAKTGKKAGSQFWGCTAYPDCKGTAPI
ncbi:MAG: four helix bundle protein [Verrucomicrobia bacterium]|nr:four helix bundle protein [Verrucomicrobiota bacterium]